MALPFVEQASLNDVLQVGTRPLYVNLTIPAGLTALQTPLATFTCPSDTGPELNNFTESLAADRRVLIAAETRPAAGRA